MCGIAGAVALRNNRIDPELVSKMTVAIAHRGPDGEQSWYNEDRTIALGHRRLSIIDLSHEADQPMHYMDRYVIVFNGEIYNYIELRNKCLDKGYRFKTQGDTEVIMAMYDWRGAACLQEFDGMFAFAIWDIKMNELFCARDRFGEKPFFYTQTDHSLWFASEMKSFWKAGLPKLVDNTMLYNYFSTSLTENPNNKTQTFYSNVQKLQAAHYLIMKPGSSVVTQIRYWDIDTKKRNDNITLSEAQTKFRDLFFTSVSRRLRSDVPVGSSLSGGLDSSLVVCVIDSLNENKGIIQKTFSAQFPGYAKDESYYQQLVIDQCETEAYFIQPTAETMLEDLEKVAYHQEEPFVSSSIYAQYEVFKLAKNNDVTVLLDGQGADEVLAGYHHFFPSYFQGLKDKNPIAYNKARKSFRELHADNTINTPHLRDWKYFAKKMLPSVLKQRIQHLNGGQSILDKSFVSQYGDVFTRKTDFADLQENLHYDTTLIGLETLLRYADRNSMAHSREVRLPFLYHELVEFIFTLPDEFKIKDGWTKWIMRSTFDDLLPKEITWRKDKIGYEPPQNIWLKDNHFQRGLQTAYQNLLDRGIVNEKYLSKGMDPSLQWKVYMACNTLFV